MGVCAGVFDNKHWMVDGTVVGDQVYQGKLGIRDTMASEVQSGAFITTRA